MIALVIVSVTIVARLMWERVPNKLFTPGSWTIGPVHRPKLKTVKC